MPEQITLYTSETCPWAQKTRIALAEAKPFGAKWTEFEVDLKNKPDFYAKTVNPASKVPAITYGGPAVPPDQPSPESIKIAESAVLVEFIADLFPQSNLLPQDPVLRAKIRFFIDVATTKFVPGWFQFTFKGASPDALYAAAEQVQELLDPEGPWFAGEQFTIADVSIAPFIERLCVNLQNDVVANPGEGSKVFKELSEAPRFARFAKYARAILGRPSVSGTTPHVSPIVLINIGLTLY
ncbi:hypothetical protein SISSUDRAFT_986163 [Sistotremastrum suecicum HHB10207 ss-3]|uniref:Glutathione S-transferase n=1 Tax=Sistotremastrum suecicum HHB10207 ss-3 TaxID=1314776 RepID=A0A166DF38_9AGAM|nr:hypothetical protein SISSUDRAFT_986163 [Sistotremastrum suecicum HHB10207 ss-3]